jgi:hypothetical protein
MVRSRGQALIILCVLAPMSIVRAAPPTEASLVIARLIGVRLVPERNDATASPSDEEHGFIFHPLRRYTYRPEKLLAGKAPSRRLTWTDAGSEARKGGKYFLLVETHGKTDEVVWVGYAGKGLCLSDSEAEEYGLGLEVRALRKQYRCMYDN